MTTKELNSALKKQTDEIVGLFQEFMSQVDERFNKIKTDINVLKNSHDRLINTIDEFIGRTDKHETS